MQALDNVLLVLGMLLLLGLATDVVGRWLSLPRVTLLILAGAVFGRSGFDRLPGAIVDNFPLVADMALLLVGFLLGGRLTPAAIGAHGRSVIAISLSVVVVSVVLVAGGLWLLGVPVVASLLLAGISTATDPAATDDVLRQYRARGPFSDSLRGIVAIDDAWGIVAFSLLLAVAGLWSGEGYDPSVLLAAGYEVAGAVLLGIVLGVPTALLTGRLRPGEPTLVEALGVVFLCGGLAELLNVSFLLSAITLGATVASLATHHERAFHEIEDIEWPFLILFFVLSGAVLDIGHIEATLFLWIMAYLLLRIAGRLLGGWIGSAIARQPAATGRWTGLALLPQAGVASGMALVAGSRYPALANSLLGVAVVTTIVFELVGPLATRVALQHNGALPPAGAGGVG